MRRPYVIVHPGSCAVCGNERIFAAVYVTAGQEKADALCHRCTVWAGAKFGYHERVRLYG